MLKLSFSAYAYLQGHDPAACRKAVTDALGLFQIPRTIGWLAVTGDHQGNSFSLAFVALARGDGVTEYDVVVRGTNPISLETWLREDLDVGTLVPWPGAQGGGRISQATATAMVLHEELLDGGEDLYSYLWDRITTDAAGGIRSVVSFTGHSLGGLLAPVMALRFSEIYPRFANLELNTVSFAAPTAGDKDFAAHMERSFTQKLRQDFRTCLFYRCKEDAAVRVWNKRDVTGMARMFSGFGVPNNLFLIFLFRALKWKVRKLSYAQPFSAAGEWFPSPAFDAGSYLAGDIRDRFLQARTLSGHRTTVRVFRNTQSWVVQAVVMHVVPYALHLLDPREIRPVAVAVVRSILTHTSFPPAGTGAQLGESGQNGP